MTVEQLNEALKAEYMRLGENREPIDKVLREYGVQSINDLKQQDYQGVVDKVRQIPAPAAA